MSLNQKSVGLKITPENLKKITNKEDSSYLSSRGSGPWTMFNPEGKDFYEQIGLTEKNTEQPVAKSVNLIPIVPKTRRQRELVF